MRSSSAPGPSKVVDQATYTRKLLVDIVESYKWLHAIGYERGTSSEEKVRTSSVQDNANLICSCGPRGTPGSCDKEKFRAEVVTAARLLNDAASRVLGADAALKRAANLIDREAPHAPAGFHDAAPRVVSRSELARAQAAQQRRALRGEGYGAA